MGWDGMVNTENLILALSRIRYAHSQIQDSSGTSRRAASLLHFCPSHHRSCPLAFPKRTSVSTDSLATPIHPAVPQPDTEGVFCACSGRILPGRCAVCNRPLAGLIFDRHQRRQKKSKHPNPISFARLPQLCASQVNRSTSPPRGRSWHQTAHGTGGWRQGREQGGRGCVNLSGQGTSDESQRLLGLLCPVRTREPKRGHMI